VNDVAYLIYTSGTTGRPKGVMVKHYGIAAAADYLVSIGAITENDRILGFFNVAFDASVLEWSTSLLNGACLIIAPEELRIDPDGLSRYMREKEVTYACLIPQMAALTDLSMISKFSTGGASAIPSLLMKYPESFYTNFYGPTEATIFAVTWNKAPHEPLPAIIPIGKPIPYDQIYILDQSQHLAGIGVPGELCIAGAGIAEGYYNLPELTNEKFVSNPFGEGKLYRTGDLARFQSDGEILFLGRIDEQVKIRGYRVELEEIEHVLLTYESISAAAVVASSDRLLAYYVSEADIQDDALSDYLSETLPDYMVPGSYLRITALPHTGSGKVDKKALPEIPIEQPKDEGIVTPEEQLVLNLFSEVLETDSIGKNTEFYKLGGDSIKAIYLVAKLREAGYDVSIKDFLKARTAGKVAKLIAEKTEEPVDPTTESFKPLELNRLALSPIQRQFFKAGYTYESHFNQSIFLKLDIDYNPNRLKAAFEALINHHDMLRAYFINGEAYIAKQADFELTYLESSDPGAIYQTCQNIQASFRLSEPPLIKAALIHTIDKDHLFICMHHLICDQVSWMILLDELRLVYEQISVTGLAKLPVKTASYDTYVNALKNMDYDGEIPYWTKIADEVKAQKMQVTQKSTLGALKVLNVSFEHALTSNLISLDSATPQEILLSALTQSLSQWNGDSVNIVSLEGHGRQIDIPIERTIGWFTTIFPVVLKDVDDTGERLEKTKSLLSEIPSGGLGYMVLTQVKGHNFDVHPKIAFNYTGISNSGILSNYDSGMDISPMNQLENQISINVAIIGGILSLNVVYDSLSFDQSNINRLLGLFEQSIRRHLQYLTKVSVFSNQESLPQNLDPEHEENTIEYVTKDLVDTELEEILDYYDWE
jgi:non-ribosomal peptide synthase protein (TIGR01720 family)